MIFGRAEGFEGWRIYRHLLLLDRIHQGVAEGWKEREAARLFCEGMAKIHGGRAMLALRRDDGELFELVAAYPPREFAEAGTLFAWGVSLPATEEEALAVEFCSALPAAVFPGGGRTESLTGRRKALLFPLVLKGEAAGGFLLAFERVPQGYTRRLLVSVVRRFAAVLASLKDAEVLREAEARFATLFGHSPVPTWELDLSGLVREVREARQRGVVDVEAWLDFRRGSGVALAESVRVTAMNAAAARLGVVPFRDVEEICRHLFASERVFEVEERIWDGEGRRRDLKCRYAVVPGHEEDGRRVVLCAEDETRLRRSMEEVERELRVNETMSMVAAAIPQLRGVDALARLVLTSCRALTGSRRALLLWRNEDGRASAVSDVPLSVEAVPERKEGFFFYADLGVRSFGEGDGGLGVLSADEPGIVVPFGGLDVRGGILALAGGSVRPGDEWVLSATGRIASLFFVGVLRHEEAERLRASEELHRTLVEAFPLNVYIIDRTGRVVFANRRGAARHGLTPEEVVGRTLSDLFTSEEARERLLAVQAAVEAGGTIYKEFPYGDRIFEASLTPVGGFCGERCVLVMSRDVTEERRTAEALRRAERMASVGRLAAGVAHEFNNILAAMRMAVQDRMHDLEAGREMDAFSWALFLRTLEDQTRRGEAVVGNLVSFAKSPRPSWMGPVRLEEVCERILGVQEHQMRLERIRVRRRYGSRRPVMADAALVEQVLMNLVLGARKRLKAMGGGELTVGFEEADGVMRVWVEDDTPTLGEVARRHLFDPFFLEGGDGDDGSLKGGGLGFSVSLRIVREHGGELRHEPGEGMRGNRFVFDLPLAQGSAEKEGGAEVRGALSAEAGIFVVEDEPEINAYVRRMLAKNGFGRVEGFVSAWEALDRLRAGVAEGWRPQVVLLDLLMPEMAGEDWYREAKALCPGLKVVVMSGQVDLERERLERLGVDGFLAKPFDAADLLEVLRGVLGG